MNEQLLQLIGHFRTRRIVVIGEAMLDTYLEGPTHRLCREAPVPVVDIAERRDVPGGAANTAVNAAALGADVRFLSAVGDDTEGALLRQALERHGVATDCVTTIPGRRTLAKHRVLAGGHMVVRFDQGDTGVLQPGAEMRIARNLEGAWQSADAVIVSDYDYGLLGERVMATLARLQESDPRVLVVDARRPERFRPARPSVITPNFDEARAMLGLPESPARLAFIETYGEAVLERSGAAAAIVTLDREGAFVLSRDGERHHLKTRFVRHASVAGAGDTFASSLALALASRAHLRDAAATASAAAAVVVDKEGTAVCSFEELARFLSSNGKALGSVAALAALSERARSEGRRIVFTNGCFDILHSGHVSYLAAARALGDVLIVGVNSDASVRRLKGNQRPINQLADRLRVLGAIDSIDHLVAFEEDTPEELIRVVRPDVFVKGGDYTETTLPEAPLVRSLGGEIAIVPFADGHSTTGIIDQIRSLERLGRRRSSQESVSR